MILFLLRFWPVLLPLALYSIWYLEQKRRAIRSGRPVKPFRDGPWYWIVLSMLLTGVACFLLLAGEQENTKGRYVPAYMKDGQIVPSHVEPGT